MEQQRLEAVDVQYTLEEEQKVIEGQDAAIQKAIELEQQRQAELKRQQEEEAKRQQQKRKKDNKKKRQNKSNKWQPAKTSGKTTATKTVQATCNRIYKSSTSSNQQVAAARSCFFKQLYSTNTRCCNIWFWISNPPCVWY